MKDEEGTIYVCFTSYSNLFGHPDSRCSDALYWCQSLPQSTPKHQNLKMSQNGSLFLTLLIS